MEFYASLNQLNALAPHHQEIKDLLIELTPKSRMKKTIGMAVGSALLLIGILSLMFINQSKNLNTQKEETPKVVQESFKIPPKEVVSIPVKPITKVEKKNVFGGLRFLVDEDVSVRVDGRKVLDIKKELKLISGKHKITLIKEGFMPIENDVVIKPTQVSWIKAKTK